MQSKIKIFLFIDSFMIGGMHKQMLYLFRNIDKNKFSPVVCVLDDHGNLKEDYYLTGSKIYNLNWKYTGDLLPIFRLYKILKKEKPDLVFITEAVNFIYYRITKFFIFNRIIHIGSFRALTFWKGHLNLFYNYLDILLSKWFYSFCDEIVVNSMAMKNNYNKILNPKISKQLAVIYNASDFKFDYNSFSKELKKHLGINSEIIITQVSRFDPWKDFETLVYAINELKKKAYNIKLILVGDGPLKEKIQNLILKTKLDDEILIVGETNNVFQYINISDICVLSSNGEGFSNAILEYMSFAKPVVASNVGGNIELIDLNRNGRLFELGSIDDLVVNLEELILDEELRIEIGKKSKEHILDLCKIENYIDSYHELFSKHF